MKTRTRNHCTAISTQLICTKIVANKFFENVPLDVRSMDKAGVCVCVCYLELLSELGGVALRVHLQHLLIGESKLIDRDGGLATQTSLQDGVMNEHVLLLENTQKLFKLTQNPHCTYKHSNC